MIDGNATLTHHLFKITVADAIAAVPTHRPQNHFILQMAPLEIVHQ
jgi:hypothetical protein